MGAFYPSRDGWGRGDLPEQVPLSGRHIGPPLRTLIRPLCRDLAPCRGIPSGECREKEALCRDGALHCGFLWREWSKRRSLYRKVVALCGIHCPGAASLRRESCISSPSWSSKLGECRDEGSYCGIYSPSFGIVLGECRRKAREYRKMNKECRSMSRECRERFPPCGIEWPSGGGQAPPDGESKTPRRAL